MPAISNGAARPWALSFSIQVSDRVSCNARCEFCISRTTPGSESSEDVATCHQSRLRVGLNYAKNLGATHTILTSKADPTQEDPVYLYKLIHTAREYLPLADMHTNGFLLQKGSRSNLLEDLATAGLTMITFSIASFDSQTNKSLMGINQQPQLLIEKALHLGLLVRCSLVVNKQSAYDMESVMEYIYQAANLGAHMVVIREVWIPDGVESNNSVLLWNQANKVDIGSIQDEFLSVASQPDNQYGLKLRDPLPWGTPVFTIDGKFSNPHHGVNITFARCDEANTGQIFKSIVHKPNGHGYRNWDSHGDILY